MSRTPDEVIREKWARDFAKQQRAEAAAAKKQHVHEQRERARQRRVIAQRGRKK